jgi:exopolysaccharide production protein ExoQ
MIIFSVSFKNNPHLTSLQKLYLRKRRPDLVI